MKDITKEELEAGRPNYSARHCIEHCLDSLFRNTEKCLSDSVSNHVAGNGLDTFLTYEELIGALLLARDILDQYDARRNKQGPYVAPSSK